MAEPKRSDGTLYAQRQKLPWPKDEPFRILSIDGGGIRGILPAALLKEMETRYTAGVPAGKFFDMIAGTSTGGIIALGLGAGLSAQSIFEFYVEHGPTIFPRRRFTLQPFRKLQSWAWAARDTVRYRYDAKALAEALGSVFGDAVLGSAERRLVVPAFDQATEVWLFKTPHHPDYKLDWKEPLTLVARATSAAPSYFRSMKDGKRRFLDGGVWANNPVMLALVDALACYDIDRRQIEILSLGCADNKYVITRRHDSGGLWRWKGIMSASSQLQSQNALGQAGLLIGRDQLLRVDAPADKTEQIDLDDFESAFAVLPGMAISLLEQHRDGLQKFFQVERPVFSAYHGERAR